MMVRVVNSLGPFLSWSKSIFSRVGKSVACISDSWRNAEDVVDNAFKHSRVSWRRVSSCSSL